MVFCSGRGRRCAHSKVPVAGARLRAVRAAAVAAARLRRGLRFSAPAAARPLGGGRAAAAAQSLDDRPALVDAARLRRDLRFSALATAQQAWRPGCCRCSRCSVPRRSAGAGCCCSVPPRPSVLGARCGSTAWRPGCCRCSRCSVPRRSIGAGCCCSAPPRSCGCACSCFLRPLVVASALSGLAAAAVVAASVGQTALRGEVRFELCAHSQLTKGDAGGKKRSERCRPPPDFARARRARWNSPAARLLAVIPNGNFSRGTAGRT